MSAAPWMIVGALLLGGLVLMLVLWGIEDRAKREEDGE